MIAIERVPPWKGYDIVKAKKCKTLLNGKIVCILTILQTKTKRIELLRVFVPRCKRCKR